MDSFIFDFETLGKEVITCPALSVAMLAFDTKRFMDNPYTIDELLDAAVFAKFNVAEQVQKYGRKIEQETLEWWGTQSPEAQKSQFKPSDSDISIETIRDLFADNIPEGATIYTRGNTFDPILLKSLCNMMDQSEPYPWWSVRDVRSLIDGLSWGTELKSSFPPPELEGQELAFHDPRVDIAVDVLRIQTLVKAIS